MFIYSNFVNFITPDGSGRVQKLMFDEIIYLLDPLIEMTSIKPHEARRQLH